MLGEWYVRYLKEVLPHRGQVTDPLADFVVWLRDQEVVGLGEEAWQEFLRDDCEMTDEEAARFIEEFVAQ